MPIPEKFEIKIDAQVLDDLRDRLRQTRWAPDFGNADWSYGVNAEYLKSLAGYWLAGFDWSQQERAINRFEHFRTSVDGIPIHFLKKRGAGPSPIPIILTHGWPWTFWDFRDVIEPLADPAAFGGSASDAFDVIVPSLPGFGFSVPLRTGVNYWQTADLWHKLMTETLGYARYAAHGGDWGALVTSQLSHKYAADLIGIHVSMPVWPGVFGQARPYDLLGPALPDIAAEDLPKAMAVEARVASHITTHLLDPQTLAYGLHDSPVGLLAWLLERWRAWSDCGGDVEKRFSRDAMLTNATIYWATESFVTTARFYAEAARQPWQPSHHRSPPFEAPAGVSLFRNDGTALFPDRSLSNYNLQFLRERSSGGHFAAAEEPAALVEDIRATFRGLR
ncbi:epoxide hydrolase family protein [Sphingomonas sp. KC8]|uniref:epoxide hydrolase family protein n=1 Tax=Sphingomonas sp. KC8 TaxID=1030157 RepID=UPI000248B537|nr:epoxide hydrolase family protein [Sphingomonas sp. KC8]ARS28356.1 epoxide hydrolase [Sphingomonas sp. KC8]